jgi:hypothetical protein
VSGVNVYRDARGTPTYYEDAEIIDYAFCGYDGNGNLFINGQGSGNNMYLAELPKGAGGFINLKFAKYVNFLTMGQLQWDGDYITLEDYATHAIYRLVVSGFYAKVFGVTRLQRWNPPNLALSWIVGDRALVATGTQDAEINASPRPRAFSASRTARRIARLAVSALGEDRPVCRRDL